MKAYRPFPGVFPACPAQQAPSMEVKDVSQPGRSLQGRPSRGRRPAGWGLGLKVSIAQPGCYGHEDKEGQRRSQGWFPVRCPSYQKPPKNSGFPLGPVAPGSGALQVTHQQEGLQIRVDPAAQRRGTVKKMARQHLQRNGQAQVPDPLSHNFCTQEMKRGSLGSSSFPGKELV